MIKVLRKKAKKSQNNKKWQKNKINKGKMSRKINWKNQ